MYPDFNHFLRMVLLMGIFFNIQSCRMLSKHPLISASKIHRADISRQRERKHCSMASLHDLRGLNPYELGSAIVSAMGSSAILYSVCMALSCITGILNGRFFPFFFGI